MNRRDFFTSVGVLCGAAVVPVPQVPSRVLANGIYGPFTTNMGIIQYFLVESITSDILPLGIEKWCRISGLVVAGEGEKFFEVVCERMTRPAEETT